MTASSRRRLIRALLLRVIAAGEPAGTAEGARVTGEAEKALAVVQRDGGS